MALLVSGMAYAHREVVLRDKPAAMLAASPKGTVPVLVLPDGTVIDESLDIMRWALIRNDPERWLPGSDASLLATFDAAFKYHLDRYKYAVRYDVDPLVHRAEGLAILGELDHRLAERGCISGAVRGFDDIALFPFVRQFAGVDAEWFDANAPQHVRKWLATLIASDLFDQAMARIAPWLDAQD